MSNKVVYESKLEIEIKDVGTFSFTKMTRKSYRNFLAASKELEAKKESGEVDEIEHAELAIDLSYDLLIEHGADADEIEKFPIGVVQVLAGQLLEVKKSESIPTK